jgi:hypothetical protein
MSRQVTLMRFPPNVRSTCELPAGYKVEPLGPRADVMSLITRLFPEANTSDWTQIAVNSQDAQAEIYMDAEHDPIEFVALRNPSENVIRTFCKATGWRAVDSVTGDLMNFE